MANITPSNWISISPNGHEGRTVVIESTVSSDGSEVQVTLPVKLTMTLNTYDTLAKANFKGAWLIERLG
jgi:hypothetical protein